MKDRRLYRSNTEKMLFGVCGGLAEYFDVDPTVVRVAFAVLALLNGVGIVLYLVLAIVVPRKPIEQAGTSSPSMPSSPPASQPGPPNTPEASSTSAPPQEPPPSTEGEPPGNNT